MAPSRKWTQSGTVESKKSKSQQQRALEAPEYARHKQSRSPASHAQERRDAAEKRGERLGRFRAEADPSTETEEVVEDEIPEAHESPKEKYEPPNPDDHSSAWDEDNATAERDSWLYEDIPDPFDRSPEETKYCKNARREDNQFDPNK